MLIQVKGIGPWTVHMFSIFSLRRPNILPVGDLGVQKGLLRWILASHSPADAKKVRFSPHRMPGMEEENLEGAGSAAPPSPQKAVAAPVVDRTGDTSILRASHNPIVPTAPGGDGTADEQSTPLPPSLPTEPETVRPIPLPDSMSSSLLRSRLAGKKTN